MKDEVLKRVSTRSYKKEFFSIEQIDEIRLIVEEHQKIKGPFDHMFEFTFTLNNSKGKDNIKIGTYGVVKNVPAFIGGVCKNEFESIVDFGYVFEMLILSLTKLSYDTCWLGGTFKRRDYRKKLNKDEIIPAISPVGHRAENRTVIDRFMRSAAKSENRLPLSELFKNYTTFDPLKLDSDNIVIQSLSLVRRAPSASNKQPWRAFIDNKYIHFYLKRTPKYPLVAKNYDIQALDIGIALAHFEIGLKHFCANYAYIKYDKIKEIKDHEYVISIKWFNVKNRGIGQK